jgi:hypothetical protein
MFYVYSDKNVILHMYSVVSGKSLEEEEIKNAKILFQ